MKRRLWVGVVLGMMLALTGCSGPDHGVVHDKDYTAGYYYTEQTCASYNNKGYCSFYIYNQRYRQPSWCLDLYASEDDHGWHCVTETEYNSVKVGDTYSE